MSHSVSGVSGVGPHVGPVHGRPARLLALDVGQARIGIAVSDSLQLAARPLCTLTRSSRRDDFARLAQLVRDEEIAAIVCGLPLNMDGSEGAQAATTRKWALRLAQALRTVLGRPLPLLFWDERLSTYAAQEIMEQHRSTARGRSGTPAGVGVEAGEDAVAAAVILQSYLDDLAQSHAQDGPPRTYDAIVLPPGN